VWVVQLSGAVHRVNGIGSLTTVVSSLSLPTDLSFDEAGLLYVVSMVRRTEEGMGQRKEWSARVELGAFLSCWLVVAVAWRVCSLRSIPVRCFK
jgi:lysylphosphatidylglycerol synthetase-like protein (DUF2156 family)